MAKYARIIYVLMSLIIFSASSAYACSCTKAYSIAERAEKSDLFFKGEVVSFTKTNPDAAGFASGSYTLFQVQTPLAAGVDSGEIVKVFHDQSSGGNCGINFELGEITYILVYKNQSGNYSTDSCFLGDFPQQEYDRYEANPDLYPGASSYCLLLIDQKYRFARVSSEPFELDEKCKFAEEIYSKYYNHN